MSKQLPKIKKESLWSGRFAQKTHPLAQKFNQSVSFDQKLYFYDIMGSMAHAKMLSKVGILKKEEYLKIEMGLHNILEDIQSGKFTFKEDNEDVHRNIELSLMDRIGPVGGKLHTARSRNDQVALDFRLYCRDHLLQLHDQIVSLERAFLDKALEYKDVVMPGYTHLQRAQPILFSHHLLAYVEMLERDRGRLLDALMRVNILPLGSGALAGTTFELDREFVAQELGFFDVSHNSLDAVSDRDFAIELASGSSILMMHLSRLCEELILWSTSEFSFIHLPENFCTGSSMMPQKMNPDIPELIRGKTGRVYGHLMGLLTVMKGLPLAYNKDMQEDKEALFDVFETTIPAVEVLTEMIKNIRPNEQKMKAAASDGFLLATELADWLVKQGSDFRSSHEVTARVVRHALDQGRDLKDLSLEELKVFSPLIHKGLLEAMTVKNAIQNRKVTGGTSGQNVIKEIKRIERKLKDL